jgi:O-antigen ligase
MPSVSRASTLFRSGYPGTFLAIALAGWALLSRPDAPGGVGMSATILLGTLAFLAGTRLARWRGEAPGIAVAAVVAALMVLALPESLTSDAGAGPLGYANANGALLAAAVAGLVHAGWHVRREVRPALLVAAMICTVAAAAIGSQAGTMSCVLLLLVGNVLGYGRRPAWQVLSGAVLVAGLLTVTTLGLLHGSKVEVEGDLVEETVSTTRTALWSESLEMAADQPLRGVGAGDFAEHSEIAREDPDLAWAHSEPLQIAAELGWVGFGLLVLLVAWMLGTLGRGAALMAVLALQPMIDYTLHFPAVVVAGAVVLGGIQHQGLPRIDRGARSGRISPAA